MVVILVFIVDKKFGGFRGVLVEHRQQARCGEKLVESKIVVRRGELREFRIGGEHVFDAFAERFPRQGKKTDADGDEWILTDQGINLIGRKRMNSDFPFRHMTEKSNRIWLISADGQLARYTPEGIHFLEQASGVQQVHQMKAISDTLLTVGTDAGLWLVHIPEGRMEQVDVRSATQPSADVLNVFKDSNRRLWMFTHSAGVVMYDMKSRECAHLQPPIHQVSQSNDHPFVYEDALGVIRVNPREGCLSYYDPQSNTLKPYVNPDGSVLKTAIRVFLVDRQKNVWYGAARNLYHITFYHDNVDYLPSLNRQEARCLFVDRGKNLWIGSKDERLRMYRDSDTDKAPLYLDTNGRLQTQPARFFANVYAMMQDSDNNLWIGTRGQGLILARPMPDGNYTLQRFHSDPADEYSISSNDIYALCQDRRGHIWIGAYQGGLNLLQTDGGHYRFIHGGNRLKNYPFPYIKSKVRSIAETPDGTILAGASEGLLAFGSDFDRPENIKFRMHTAQYDYSDGMTCTEVMHVGATHKGIYLATAKKFDMRPVTIRLADLGADKLPDFPLDEFDKDNNPFMGCRGIRLFLKNPELMHTQLRAIVRTACEVPAQIKIMVPMLSSLEELRHVRAALNEVLAEFEKQGKKPVNKIALGAMIEVPAAAIALDGMIGEMDFLSIGTNDLIQYLIAVDRVNPEVAHMYDPCHPAVVRTIRQIIQTAHQRGRQVSICGEIASDVRMVPMLLGLEVDTLSVPPRMFLRIKNRIRNLNFEACSDMAQAALLASSSEEIRKLIETQSQDEDS